ncbi:DUF5071 domain-containing protein [Cohnella mopanensis]|uniref:DUF5071 domain-containing protein n=1 Tax=Cohnella mopanensis TaxID=2911966 RepID=UPI001EF8C491|nr:DUF5071 domain-containing protein [Cohnella mopanensis]
MINDDRLKHILKSNNLEIYIPELLEGIQDMNWPNAEQVVEILKPLSKQSIPHVKAVLKTNDTIWIYWVLTQLVCTWPKGIVKELESELINLSNKLDNEDELDLAALRILVGMDLYNKAELLKLFESKLKSITKELEAFSEEQISEFYEIEVKRIEIILSKPSGIMEFIRENSIVLEIKNNYERNRNYLNGLMEIKELF